MENASRAIIMAGGMLIAIVLITVLVIVFSSISDVYTEEGTSLTTQQLEEYNRKFSTYDKSLYGSELLSLANLVHDYNERLLYGNEDTEFYEDNKITVKVYFYAEITGITGSDGKTYYEGISKGVQPIEELRLRNNELVEASKTDSDAKSLLTELRSLPFMCISNDELKAQYESQGYKNIKTVKYNKYGRISEMYFIQIIDQNILQNIHKNR